jgi:hypothetical protein
MVEKSLELLGRNPELIIGELAPNVRLLRQQCHGFGGYFP